MRLDRFLVQAAGLSRSVAQKQVRGGCVTVNGALCRQVDHKVGSDDEVLLKGAVVRLQGPRYLMLHKPVGYVCASKDDRYPTVLELLPPEQRSGLHIAGRLDLDTTGLVLLTDDGDWSHRVTSPRHVCSKRYRVELAEPVTEAQIEQLRAGMLLRGEKQPTRPAEVESLSSMRLLLTIHEGRYHQVKRMFGALGNRVVTLHRDRVGPLELDDSLLSEGEWRPLSPAEVVAMG